MGQRQKIRLGLREKIVISILATSIIVSSVLSAIFYWRSASIIKSNYSRSVASSLTVCANKFDDMMREAYYASVNAASDSKLHDLMQNNNADDYTDILKLLEDYRTTHIDSICCYFENQRVLLKTTKSGTMIQPCSTLDLVWIAQTTEKGTNPLAPVCTADQTSVVKKQIFTYSKPIYDNKTGEMLGHIFANVDERMVFFGCLQGNEHSGDGESYIVSSDQRVASGSNLKQLGHTVIPIDEKVKLKTAVTAPLSGYQFFSSVDKDIIMSEIKKAQREILLITLLLNMLFCVPILFIVRSMMRPIKNLESAMEQISQGNLSVRAEIYHNDEIGRLSEGFNNMVEQIETLIEELVTQKLLKKEAELEALRHQITPHFMYNTLNSIRYAAILRNSFEISELLEAFIQLLQVSASDSGAFVTVEEEIHMVRNYTKLQLFRYANHFEVQFDIQQEVKDCYLPSLLIQPLVENAILHGIDMKKTDGKITIRAMEANHTLVIKVEDNGRGMTAEDLKKLMSGERRSKFSGIGVRNIRERLKLYYGDRGKLEFYSAENHGSNAVICLPISRDSEEYTI